MARYLLLLILIACRQDNMVVLRVPDKTGYEMMSKVAKDVNELLGCEAVQVTNSGRKQNSTRREIVVVKSEELLRDSCTEDAVGCYDVFNDEIYYTEMERGEKIDASVRDNSDDPDFNEFTDRELYEVLIHELGHAFGLDHVDGTVMNPGVTLRLEEFNSQSFADMVNERSLNPCTHADQR